MDAWLWAVPFLMVGLVIALYVLKAMVEVLAFVLETLWSGLGWVGRIIKRFFDSMLQTQGRILVLFLSAVPFWVLLGMGIYYFGWWPFAIGLALAVFVVPVVIAIANDSKAEPEPEPYATPYDEWMARKPVHPRAAEWRRWMPDVDQEALAHWRAAQSGQPPDEEAIRKIRADVERQRIEEEQYQKELRAWQRACPYRPSRYVESEPRTPVYQPQRPRAFEIGGMSYRSRDDASLDWDLETGTPYGAIDAEMDWDGDGDIDW